MRILLILFLLCPLAVNAQQLADKSAFTENGFIWNPAMTAAYNFWELSANYRQQWMGFNDAPSTAILGMQYPILDKNMSLGGSFIHDRVNPLSFTSFSLYYAYKFEVGISPSDQLSVGIMATMNQYFLDGLEIVVNDPDDELLPNGENNGFSPNAGFGVYYTSYAKDTYSKNYVFAGFGINQIFPVDVQFEDSGSAVNLKRAFHGNGLFGARFINEGFFVEPSAWVNFAGANISSANFNLRIEKVDAFWGGLTFSTNQTLALQLGYIVSEGLIPGSTIRIGTLGSFNLGTFGNYRGLGYEFFISYRFEL